MITYQQDKETYGEVVGLLPAGGRATRIAPLPCSKELYPVGFHAVDGGHGLRPKVVCQYLLEKMRLAGINKVYIVLREGKWDIPAYLGDGELLNMHLAYLMMRLPFGVPYTVDQAYPFVQDALVAFGFADVIFQPEDVFVQLLVRQKSTKADIVLGLFPTDQPQKWDMVDLDESGKVRRIVIKPPRTHLRYTWIVAVWTPIFSHFMHEYLISELRVNGRHDAGDSIAERPELFIGDVIQAAIENNLQVDPVFFTDGNCLDIGTPEDLVKAVCGVK